MKQNKLPTICLKNVSKCYDAIQAVDDVSFEGFQGEIIALLGPNGAGKSTLMNMISGFLATTTGDIIINGLNMEENNLQIKKDIGFLSEGSPLYGDMTVKAFLNYMIEIKLNYQEKEDFTKKDIRKLYHEELERIADIAKIKDVMSQKIETLSKGYVRRVGFAQSIIGNPPILLLDEPTDGLDPNQKVHIRKIIKNMGKNKTIIISTHLLDDVESLSTRILLINKGKLIAQGSLKQILEQNKQKSLADVFYLLTNKGAKDE